MRARALATVVVVLGLVAARAPAALADGVCVRIDRDRDSLGEPERFAVQAAIEAALEREGVAVDRGGPGAAGACVGGLRAYAVQLGQAVTVTIVAGDRQVRGRADDLDEVDLLIAQLVRSLVTGRALATGTGVADRTNVLRAQAAPRRADASTQRRWQATFAIGGGMLQLPALAERPRQRQYDVVALESRWWGFAASERAAFEFTARVLLHDYAAIGAADEAYDRAQAEGGGREGGRLAALVFSPFAVANYEAGLGFVAFAGARAPRPWVRAGVSAALLFRFSDPDHRADLGLGPYAGVGVQLAPRVSLSIAAHASHPVVHDFLDRGYWYVATTTALLEIHGRPHQPPPRGLLPPDASPPVIRVIHD